MLKDRALVDAVLADYATAAISEKLRALFVLVDKINRASTSITQQDISTAIAAGWSQEAIYDAITVSALFQFFNTWVDATGVKEMSTSFYAHAGKRLAAGSYAPMDVGDTL